jgi:hypothetical protein
MVGILQKCNTRNISGKGWLLCAPTCGNGAPVAAPNPARRASRAEGMAKAAHTCRMVAHAGALIGVDFLNEIDPR